MKRSSSRPEYHKIQLVFDQPLDESIMEELAASIAMAYHKPVVQVSSEKLELSLTPEEADRILPSIPEVVRPIAGCAPSIVVESYDSINWESEWKKYIKPIKVGTRFLICPSWEKSSSDSRIVINIDPGMAFGTGHHETTRLCLEWIDNFATRHGEIISDLSFLDVGTGSGILAIGAALVGFSQIVAIDNDPEAITVAAENALKNGVRSRIKLLVAEPGIFKKDKIFNVTMANIQANVLVEIAQILVQITSGRLVLSGILREQETDVRSAFEKLGAVWKETIQMGEWVLIDFQTGRDDWI